MRISGSPFDVDHWRNHFAEVPKVLLDGNEQFHVTEASDEFGYVVVELRGEDGKLKLAEVICDGEVIGGVVATKRLSGKVEIVGQRRR